MPKKKKIVGHDGSDDLLSVAIVGVACRFPGAGDRAEFWRNLIDGRDCITDFDTGSDASPAIASSGVLDGVEYFDNEFFGLSLREAQLMNPQHRIFLETAWHALEDAGCDPFEFAGDIGCYASCGMDLYSGTELSSYFSNNVAKQPHVLDGLQGPQVVISQYSAYMPTRASYKLNLRGPSVNVQSACSSGLVAVHLACQGILSGDCEMAIAGASALHFPLRMPAQYEEGSIFSKDGRCRPFDASGQGIVGANGVGVVVLKPLSDALRDNDRIYAVILGSAVNNDGNDKISYTAPSVSGQTRVIRKALRAAGTDPRSIGYVEAHGTGTAMGDPVEIAALTEVFREHAVPNQNCAIGSVKSNIGHTDSASGIAGLIKTVMALNQRVLPATIHFDTPNAAIDFANTPFYVNATTRPWPRRNNLPNRAAVSSFGAGGTNAHIVLEQSPAPVKTSESDDQQPQLLAISARSAQAFRSLLQRYLEYSPAEENFRFIDLCHTANCGRRHFNESRCGFVARNLPELKTLIERQLEVATPVPTPDRAIILVCCDFADPPRAVQADLQFATAIHRGFAAFRHIVAEFDDCYPGPIPVARLLSGEIEVPHENPSTIAVLGLAIRHCMYQFFSAMGFRPDALAVQGSGHFFADIVTGALSIEQALSQASDIAAEPVAALKVYTGGSAVGWRCINSMNAVSDRGALKTRLGDLSPVSGDAHWVDLGEALAIDLAAGSQRCGTDAVTSLLTRLADIYATGRNLNWKTLYTEHAIRRLTAPSYPFDKVRAWLDDRAPAPAAYDTPATAASEATRTETVPAAGLPRPNAKNGGVSLSAPLRNFEVQWRPADRSSIDTGDGEWLLISSNESAAMLAGSMRARGLRCEVIHAARPGRTASQPEIDFADPTRIRERLSRYRGGGLAGVVYFCAAGHATAADTHDEIEAAYNLAQCLLAETWPETPRLRWITRRAVDTGDDTVAVDPGQAAIWGLFRSFMREAPWWPARIVDTDNAPNMERLLDEVLARDAGQLALRAGQRYAPWLVPRIPELNTTALSVDPAATYLIVGGLGGVGLHIAGHLIEGGARNLILAGRNPATGSAAETLQRLRATGATVIVGLCDVGESDDVEGLMDFIAESMPPLKGIVHAAGSTCDRLIVHQPFGELLPVLRAKIDGAWNLHAYSVHLELDFFLLCSSIAGLFGSAGQAAYGAANAYLDALAAHRRHAALPATSIAWGAWDNTGMTRGLGGKTGKLNYAEIFAPIEPDRALRFLDWCLHQKVHSTGLVALQPGAADVFAPCRLDRWPASPVTAAGLDDGVQAAPPLARDHGEQTTDITTTIQRLVHVVAGASFDKYNDHYRAFTDYGIDSLGVLQLRERIAREYGIALSSTALFEHVNIAALAEHVAGLLASKGPPAGSGADHAGSSSPAVRTTEPGTAAGHPAGHPEPSAPAPGRIDHDGDRPAPASPPARTRDIAIVAMAGRFPGGIEDVETLWMRLLDGFDATGPVPRQRWDADRFYSDIRQTPGHAYTRTGAFVDDVDLFDPQFFGISPREAEAMDPQQRLLVESCHQALELAGMPWQQQQSRRGGVFIGIGSDDYAQLCINAENIDRIGIHNSLGTARSVAAGRIAYLLGLQGPVLQIDTSCSSSLVSVHSACQSLLLDECDFALAGGVHLNLSPISAVSRCQSGALSADGRCKTFDASADGFGQGEGVGVVLLKRLGDALQAGDPIVAVIKGSAVNHDGRSNGLTAPSQAAQEKVMIAAIERAGIAPHEVQYIEAHGTGTVLGDPIEIEAIQRVYGEGRLPEAPLLVGSVKTNFGHLEAASGVLSLIKTAMSLQRKQIPPHLHLERPNPHIAWSQANVAVPVTVTPWPSVATGKRTAGVSAFGLSGTNAHIIVQQAPEPAASSCVHDDAVLTISAKSPEALQVLCQRYETLLVQTDAAVVDLCFTSNVGKSHYRHRRAVVGRDRESLMLQLKRSAAQVSTPAIPRIVLLFSGQGSQYPSMGMSLYESSDVYRKSFDQCDALFSTAIGLSVREAIASADGGALRDGRIAQAAIFSFQYASALMWRAAGIHADAVIGHSIGEYAAACLAGVMTLDDAVTAVVARSQGMASLAQSGGMLAVRCGTDIIERFLAPYADTLAVSAINAEQQVVVAGDSDALEHLQATLADAGVAAHRLAVTQAFHSPAMEPMIGPFKTALEHISLRTPEIEFISTLSGHSETLRITDPAYWCEQIRKPVRFRDAIEHALQQDFGYFLEIGPGPVLTGLTRSAGLSQGQRADATSPGAGAEQSAMKRCLASLYERGVEVDWGALHAACTHRRVALPWHPYRRKRYWSDVAMTFAALPVRTITSSSTGEIEMNERDLQLNEIVRDAVAEALALPAAEVPLDTPLLDLGADSFTMVRVINLLDERCNIRLSVKDLFESLTTIGEITARLAADPALHVSATQPAAGMASAEHSHDRKMSANDDCAQPERSCGGDDLTRRREATHISTAKLRTADSTAPERSTEQAVSAAGPKAIPSDTPDTGAGATELPGIAVGSPSDEGLTREQSAYLDRFIELYWAKTYESRAHRDRGRQLCRRSIEFGSRAQTRKMLYPIVAADSRGAYFSDLDGNRYVDLAMGYGSLLFGHSPPFLIEAVQRQLDKGLAIAPETELASAVAKQVCEVGKLDRALFVNTGTEAVMTALRIARAATSRDKIVLFKNSYHGHFDGTLAKPGEGYGSEPMALGTPQGMVDDVVTLSFGDERSLDVIDELGPSLAAVLVEPVQSRRPDIQNKAFLRRLRELADRHHCALIFDEIFHGFRIALGGLQEWSGVPADIVTYGKAVANGYPIGIVVGRNWCMSRVDGGEWDEAGNPIDPVRTTFTAGTFSKHPLAMAAANAVLGRMISAGGELQQQLNHRTEALTGRLNKLFEDAGVGLRAFHFGSFFRFAHGRNLTFIHDYQPLELDLFCYHLIFKNIYLWEGRTCFLSTAHSDDDIDRICDSVESAVAEMKDGGFFADAERPASVAPAIQESPGEPATAKIRSVAADTGTTIGPVAGSTPAPELSLYFFGDYPAQFHPGKYDLILDSAQAADRAGFKGVWVPERHFDSFGGFSPNPAVVSSALAVLTQHIRINASVVLPLHQPIRVAEEWSVVDNLSHGRVGLAFASGWHSNDFVLAPNSWRQRHEITFDSMDLVRRLWRGGIVPMPGVDGQLVPVELHPAPAQPELPVWVVSLGNRETIETAGAKGANLLTNLIGQSVSQLADSIRVYREQRRLHGFDEGHVTVLVHTYLGHDLAQVKQGAATPLRNYLGSSVRLFNKMSDTQIGAADFEKLDEADRDQLLAMAQERFIESASLIGTPDSCMDFADALGAAGVDEIACFIDFGIAEREIRDGLEHLFEFRQRLRGRSRRAAIYRERSSAPLVEPETAHNSAPAALITGTDDSGAGGVIVASKQQRMLWMLSKIDEKASIAHNQATTLSLRGRLDVAALQDAIQCVVQRHDSLRATISADGERLTIHDRIDFDVPVLDYSDHSRSRQKAMLSEFFDAQSRLAFDMSGPLFRFAILRLDAERHLLCSALHLLICDGVSLGIVFHDLQQLYSAAVEGQPARLAQPMQFGEFEARRRAAYTESIRSAQQRFWHHECTEKLAETSLVSDALRPLQKTYNGGRHISRMDSGKFTALKQLSRDLHVSPFMVLFGIFLILVHRRSNQNEITVGAAFSGRSRLSDGADCVGHFSNLLPVFWRADNTQTFSAYIAMLSKKLLTIYDNQDFPIADLIESFGNRSVGRSPLIDIVFNWDSYSIPEMAGLKVDYYPQAISTASRDLMPTVFVVNDALTIAWDYNSDLFDPKLIEEIASNFDVLIDSVLADQNRLLAGLPLLTPEQQTRVLGGDAMRTDTAVSGPCSLQQMFQQQAARHPEKIAVVDEQRRMSFAELNSRANQVARYLQTLQLPAKPKIAVLSDRSVDTIVAFVAAIKLGGAVIPLSPKTAPATLRAGLLHADAVVTTDSTQWSDANEALASANVVRLDAADIETTPDHDLDTEGSERSLAYVMYTSGTTGTPNGVMVEHGSLINLIRNIDNSILTQYPGKVARIGVNSVFHFDASVKQWAMIFLGYSIVIVPEQEHVDPERLLEFVERHRIDVLDVTPAQLWMLIGAGMLERSSELPRIVLCGGDAIDQALWDCLASNKKTLFFNVYGPTECTVDTTFARIEPGRSPTIGHCLDNVSAYVLDEGYQLVPDNMTGELYIGGAGVARGYIGRPDLTAERFVPDRLSTRRGARMYRSGDLVKRRSDGSLDFQRRNDTQVKILGHRVELREIASVMQKHPQVRQAFVRYFGDKAHPVLTAYWIAQASQHPAASELQDYLAAQLPLYMVPSHFVRMERFPLDANGKIAASDFPLPTEKSLVQREWGNRPTSKLELAVAACFGEILNIDRVGPDDDFFLSGGSSLMLPKLAHRLEKRCGIDIPIRELFRFATPRDIAAHGRPIASRDAS